MSTAATRLATDRWSAMTEEIERCDVSCAALDDVKALVASATKVHTWLESVLAAAATRLRQLAAAGAPISPTHTLAEAANTDPRPADRIAQRSQTLDDAPALQQALADGHGSGAHVDALARTLRTLDAGERDALLQQQDHLAAVARTTTPHEFKRFLDAQAQRVRRSDGIERFEQQRRATRLRTWWSRDDGMLHLRGQFDPESGQLLEAAITQRVDLLFHDTHPATCPTDPIERHAHLQALALTDLATTSGHLRHAQTSVHVLIDLDTLRSGLHDHSVVRGHSPDAQLPVETIRRHACTAGIIPTVLDGAGVPLDVGRARRLATAAQRHALLALYPTCALCDTPFHHCKIHHLQPWDPVGETNLGNLLPLCSTHHHLAHEGGWRLELDPSSRQLTIVQPDGTRRVHPPPGRPLRGPP